jgi:quinol monooxygenase YgiN
MSKMTLRVIAHLKARTGRGEELREVLHGLVGPTRKEPGCLQYQLLADRDSDLDFTFLEEWRDEEALAAHFETEHLRHARERFHDLLEAPLDLRKYRLLA